jgi:hypothetical protein
MPTADNSADAKPICRLVSLLPESRANSENNHEVRRVAVAVVMVALLGFACMGVVFTLKHRQLRSESNQAAEVLRNAKNPSSHPVKPNMKVAPSPLPVVQNSAVPPVENPSVPLVANPPAVIEAELLTTLPREIDPVAPATVAKATPRSGQMADSTPEPKVPATATPDVPKEKPVAEAPKKFPEVEAAIDPKLTTFGTAIGFYPFAAEANEAARKDNDKLVMVMHYGGTFDQTFKSEPVEAFRQNCLLNSDVVAAIKLNFVCSATSRKTDGRNSVVTYFCLSNGTVLHAIAGPVSAEVFLREINWMLETRKTAAAEYQKDKTRYAAVFRKAHTERYFEMVADSRGMLQIPPVVPLRLPIPCPANVSSQAKVHHLLGSRALPELKAISDRVFASVTKESTPP